MKDPLLTVIIPVYNAEKYLNQTINSILGQTFEDWELVICDDGSADSSWELIKSFKGCDKRVKILRNKINQGKVSTVNSLIKLCRGKYLTIHDADDWSELDRFEYQIQFLNMNNDYIGIGTQFYKYEINGAKLKSTLNLDSNSIKEGLINKSQIHGPTLVFRREALEKLQVIYRPFFDDYNEDYDLCVRLSQLGNLGNLPQYLYNYRSLSNSLSKRYSLKRVCSNKIMQHLIKQRYENGLDDLDKNNLTKITEILNNKKKEYIIDSTLPYREHSEILFHNGFFREAISTAFKAIINNPLNLKNYRLLQFMLRKKIFKF